MPRMRAADAAVKILELEGATQAFGLPGAAINPFYSAMRDHGGIKHVLARHVEGASHMAEGYTRAKAGNIGICIGTSGPAGTDMITGLYSAMADSIPILAITGQAPVARLHKEDFQAVDIAAIAAPVTKMAMTVLEPAQVPGAFAQAFHLMRSGSARSGADRPADRRAVGRDRLRPGHLPAAAGVQAGRDAGAGGEGARHAAEAAERPLIVAGGGIINADAADLLVELAELLDVPVVPTLMGWGTIPDDHRLFAGMVGLQTAHRYGNATMLASDFVLGIGNRWANRHTGGLDTYCRGRTFVHVDIEPTQIGRVFAPDYGIVSDAKAALQQFVAIARERQANGATPDRSAWVEDCATRKRTMQRKTHFDEVPVKPQRVYEEMNRVFGRDTRYVSTIGLSQIAGGAVPARVQAAELDQLRAGRTLGLDHPRHARGGDRGPGRDGGGAFRRLRLPVHDRGTRGRRPVQPALHPRRGEQLLPGPDPAGAARVRHGLLRATRLRQHQLAGNRSARRAARDAEGLRRRSRQGRRGTGLQGNTRDRTG